MPVVIILLQYNIIQQRSRTRKSDSRREKDDRAPVPDNSFPDVLWQPAPARLPCGTRKGGFTVASFRTWRGSPVSVAQDPALNTTYQSRFQEEKPQTGIQPCYSGLQVTGHRYLPV